MKKRHFTKLTTIHDESSQQVRIKAKVLQLDKELLQKNLKLT